MHQPKRFNNALLLIALPLLAVAMLVYQGHSQQKALEVAKVSKPRAMASIAETGPPDSSFHWSPTASQKLVLKQRWKKSKTLPVRVTAAGSSLPAANAMYTLNSQFDLNGFEYYQNYNKAQYCQWSTINHCWCIRSSLVVDSPTVAPSAEYISYGKQTYLSGPAGTYWFGGMCPMIQGSLPPTVTVASTSR